ncbi:hypothetical protein [Christiangramia aestuarii]|uniref:PorT family protein n=1 Tax=Christiangramia aestuarii TaxID=1028746 RepID=A0A7M3SYG4_9FLAO|nr:hypothetical protein [Christiangramia aestuarii]MUP41645.1 hypothetical protein [Christiangramia aestuarii]
MRKFSIFIAILFCSFAHAQLEFEKGYFINNSGETTECLIKNMDWNLNPDEFEYKISGNSQVETAKASDVREFKVGDFYYVGDYAKIEISSTKSGNLDQKRSPDFEEKNVFLRLLVNGEIDLLEYKTSSKSVFFYRKGDDEIEPLIYKKYLVNRKILENQRFRQQISNELTCENLNFQIQNIYYTRSDLMSYFTKLNNCINSTTPFYVVETGKPEFYFSPVVGLGYASLNVDRGLNAAGTELNGLEYGLGANLEYNFSFNNYKWSAVGELFYRSFSDEKFVDARNYDADLRVNYNSVNFFLGVKHYLFLNTNMNLFLQAGPVIDMPVNSEILFANTNRAMDPVLEDLDITLGFRFGVGLDFSKKFHVGMNYESRAVNGERFVEGGYDLDWKSSYNSLNLKLGYKIF